MHKEVEIEKWFVTRVKQLHAISIKLSFASYLGSAGWPDRLLIVPRNKERGTQTAFYFVELKTLKGKLTKRQKLRHEQLDYCGCNVITLYGMDETVTWLQLIADFHQLGSAPKPTCDLTSN